MSGDCVWQEDDEGTWETGCGGLFDLNHGTPRENRMLFCCYCGRPLAEAKAEAFTQRDGPDDDGEHWAGVRDGA